MKFFGLNGFLFSISFLIFGCSHSIKLNKITSKQIESENGFIDYNNESIEWVIQKSKNDSNLTKFFATDLFLKANAALMDEEFDTAAFLFKYLTQLVPDEDYIQKKYAISLIKSGQIELATPVMEKLYKSKKESKMGLILAGLYSSLENEEKAKFIYKEILKKDPKNEDACIFLGNSLVSSKQNAKAIELFHECSDKNKKSGVYDFYIGKIYVEDGRTKEALKYFQKSFKKQPSLNQSVSALGAIYEEMDQFDLAIETYKNFLKNKKNDSLILSRLIQALFVKEKYEEIIPYAERLSDLEPENLNLKVKLGVIYTDIGDYSKGLSIFKELLTYAPQSDKIIYYIAAIYQEMTNFQLAIEYYNQIPSSSPLFADSSIQIANMLSSLAVVNEDKFKQKFISFVDQSLLNLPDQKVEFSVIKSGYFEAIGDYKNALTAILVAKDEKGFSNNHKYYLANLYEKEKKFDESTDIIMNIIDQEPKNAHAWNFLGYAILERGNEIDQAYTYIKKAIEISPNDGYIRDSLGWYYYKKGQMKKALKEIEFALKLVPDDIEILKHLAQIHKEMRNFSKARSFLNSALKFAKFPNDRKSILISLDELDDNRIPASNSLDR